VKHRNGVSRASTVLVAAGSMRRYFQQHLE
jgi:hypothetical protein